MDEPSSRVAELTVEPERFELAGHQFYPSSMAIEGALQKRSGAKGKLVQALRGHLKGVPDRQKCLVAGEFLQWQ